jgi:hypothetical protein
MSMRVTSPTQVLGDRTKWEAYSADRFVYGQRLFAIASEELTKFEKDIWLLFIQAQKRFRLAQNYYMRPGHGFELMSRILQNNVSRRSDIGSSLLDSRFRDESMFNEAVMTYMDIDNLQEGDTELPRRATAALHRF